MTLIVGIVCRDGVVVAADGAATMGTIEQPTVRQPTRKLQILDDRVIVGVSGFVGLGQRIIGQVGTAWTSGQLKNQPPHIVMTMLRQAIFENHIGMELQVAGMVRGALGNSSLGSATCFTVVALPMGGKSYLFHFDRQGAPEQATTDLPFIAIGSGNIIADPFLAFIRRIFWQDSAPTVQDGIFAAVWTVDQAISTNPGGVAEPVQVCVLEEVKGGWAARELPQDELQEHRQAIQDAETRLRTFQTDIGVAESSVAPTIPPTPE